MRPSWLQAACLVAGLFCGALPVRAQPMQMPEMTPQPKPENAGSALPGPAALGLADLESLALQHKPTSPIPAGKTTTLFR
jgi:hypothetical protein